MHAKTQVTARSRLAFGMALMIGVAAHAADANGGGRAAMAPSVPAAAPSTFQLAMMDGMDEMGGSDETELRPNGWQLVIRDESGMTLKAISLDKGAFH